MANLLGSRRGLRRTRGLLYKAARVLGDIDALSTGSPKRIGKRIGRRLAGRATGRLLRRLFR